MAEIHQHFKAKEPVPARIRPTPRPMTPKPWPDEKIHLSEWIDCPHHTGLNIVNQRKEQQ